MRWPDTAVFSYGWSRSPLPSSKPLAPGWVLAASTRALRLQRVAVGAAAVVAKASCAAWSRRTVAARFRSRYSVQRRVKKPVTTPSPRGTKSQSLSVREDALRFAADYSHYLEPPRRLTSSDWLESLCGLPRSKILRRIRHPLLAVAVVAVLVSSAHCLLGMPCLPTLAVHTLLGSGLSLLLVFRTNSAYQRFQEGRKIWNDILDLCRDIALNMSLFRKEAGSARIHVIRTSLQAFPFAMQKHVRAKESGGVQERLEMLLKELQHAKSELSKGEHSSSEEESGPSSVQAGNARVPPNRPLQIIARLLKAVKTIRNQGDAFTNRERVWLLSMVTSLSHTVGRCERLVQTPVPLSYARHTSRFVSAWALTLPLALVGSLRWLTAPVSVAIAWALLGILEIGHMIEDPFRASIELTPICEAIFHDCERALPHCGPKNEGKVGSGSQGSDEAKVATQRQVRARKAAEELRKGAGERRALAWRSAKASILHIEA